MEKLTDCLCWFIQMEMIMPKSKKLEDIAYQKVLSRIIMSSSNGKNFYDQLTDSDIKKIQKK